MTDLTFNPLLQSAPVLSEPDLTYPHQTNFDLTCVYEPGVNSQCAKNVLEFKASFVGEAEANGVTLRQYYNTPSCDGQDFKSKLFPGGSYQWLLRTKEFWDPDNMFHHCFSVGSTEENCCPPPV